MVRIHSPRPNIPIEIIELRHLKALGFQPPFRFCAQNCAHPAHLAPLGGSAIQWLCTLGLSAHRLSDKPVYRSEPEDPLCPIAYNAVEAFKHFTGYHPYQAHGPMT